MAPLGVVLVDQEGSHRHPSSPSREARANITVVLDDVLEQEGPPSASSPCPEGPGPTVPVLLTNNSMLEQNKVNKQCFQIIQLEGNLQICLGIERSDQSIYYVGLESSIRGRQSNLVNMYYYVLLYIKNF